MMMMMILTQASNVRESAQGFFPKNDPFSNLA